MKLKSNMLRDAIALALVVGLSSVGSAFAHGNADQNQDQQAKNEDAKTLNTLVVTGSRLKRAEIEGALPVTVIDRAQIEASGEVSVSDYLRTSNFNSTGQFRPQSGSSAQAGAFADLRGLGGQRTLVLIDGHRAPKAPFSAGSGTDLNAIPLAAVERIEVLTDGASAIYGADAVGGVINIITRKDFDGAVITLGKTDPKWGATEDGSVTFGISGDRGHMVGGFSFNRRSMIYTNQRPWGQIPGASVYGNNYSSYDPVTGAAIEVLKPVANGCNDKDFYIQAGTGRCVYDFNATAADEASYGNKSFFLNGEFNINDTWSAYLSTQVTNTKSFGRYAPTPGVVTLDPDSIANPNPGSITYLYHRFAAAGNRDNYTDSNVYDILMGFRGSFGDNIDVDFGVRHNTYKYAERGLNYIVGSLAEQAINAGLYDIKNPSATPQDVLNSIKATISRDSEFTTDEVFGSATFNDLFDLSGGSSSVAVGFESRRENYADLYDSLSSAGVVLGSSGASSGGSRRVSAVYGEWLLPFTNTLEADIAGRFERYSDYGSNFAPKIALRWHPIDSLTLRGSVGKGFVAPTLDVITQETAFSADSIVDEKTCAFYGEPDVNNCSKSGGIQVDSYREKAVGLGPEKSTQFQLGAVWDATNWLNLTLDYWNIRISDRIAYYGSQTLIDIENGDNPKPMPGAPCSLTRDPNKGGAVTEIHNCYFNEGDVKTDGVDFTARANFNLNEWGRLSHTLQATYSHSFKVDNGEENVRTQGFPSVRATLMNNWNFRSFDTGVDVRYIGSNGEGADYTRHYTTYDIHTSVELPWKAKLSLGVNNVTNKMPELIGYDGRPFNFYLYDAYGRTPYVRYEQRF